MGHKYRIGQDVYYRPSIKYTAAPGIYKIVGILPVESEGRLTCRIKSAAETFDRIVLRLIFSCELLTRKVPIVQLTLSAIS